MTDVHSASTAQGTEAVGLFAERARFEACVNALLAAGFAREDLSLLSSHESLEAMESSSERWQDVLASIVGDIRFEAPLVASGAILLAGGAVAAPVAGLIGAAVGAVALRDVVERVTSTPNSEDFERALKYGSVILWVRANDEARLKAASDLLEAHGADNVHTHVYET